MDKSREITTNETREKRWLSIKEVRKYLGGLSKPFVVSFLDKYGIVRRQLNPGSARPVVLVDRHELDAVIENLPEVSHG